MRKITFILMLSLVSLVGKATPIDYSTFFSASAMGTDPTLEKTSAVGSWAAGTTVGADVTNISPTVAASTLSYSNYIDNNAGKQISLASMATSNTRVSYYYLTSATTNNSGTFYTSALINMSTVGASSTAVLCLDRTLGTSQRAKVYIKSSGAGFVAGIGISSGTGITFSSTVYNLNEAHLIVVKFSNPAIGNDVATLYVDPTPGTLESANTAVSTQSATAAGTNYIKAITLIQNPGFAGKVAGIRFSTSWAEVIAPKIATPTANDAATINSTGFTASWSAVPNASSYDVKVYSGGSQVGSTVNTASTSLIISTLSSSTSYTYTVTAKVGATTYDFGNSLESTASNAFSTTGAVSALATPTNGSASLITAAGFTANWTAVANSESYDIKVYNSVPTLVSTTTASGEATNTKAIIGLSASTAYTYTVTATTTSALYSNSSASSPVSVTTNAFVTLSTPTVGVATAYTATGFTANWTAVSNASSYDVKLYQGASLISTTNFTGQATASGALSGLTAGLSYTYTVTAKGDGAVYSDSPASAASAAYTSGTPGMLSAIDIRSTGFTAYWVQTSGVTSYDVKLYQGTDLISTNTVAISGTGATASPSYIYTGLMAGLSYTYTVTSSDGFTSATSSSVSLINPTILETFSTWTAVSASAVNQSKLLYDGVTTGVFTCTTATILPSQSVGSAGTANGNARPSAGRLALGGTANPLVLPNVNNISTITIKAQAGTSGAGFKIQSSPDGVAAYTDVVSGSATFLSTVNTAATINVNSASNTYLKITPLQSGTIYLYDIQVNPYISATKLSTPIVGTPSVATATGFTANWTALSSDALGYYVKVYQGSTLVSTTYCDGLSSSSLVLTGLASGSTYTYKVVSKGDLTNFASSDASDASTSISTGSQLTRPVVSTASNIYSSGFTAAWTTSANASGYVVKTYLQGSASSFNTTNVSGQAVGSVIVTGLDPETIYTYKVYATGDNVTYFNSSYSLASTEFTTKKLVSVSGSSTASVDLTTLALTDDILVGSGGTLNLDASIALNKITVAAGGKLTLADTKAITANTIILQSTASGTASFVDENTSGSAITATVQQYLTSGRNWYMTIPVQSASTTNFSSAGSVVRYYEPNGQWYTQTVDSVFNPMRGYISAATATTGAVSFTGTLNTGEKYIDLTRTSTAAKPGFNLVGNPYPSFVNWESATKTNLETTMWYRSRNAGNSTYIFDTYNATTHAGTGNNGTTVTTNIPPMQAFWVRVATGNTTGRLTLNNTMRSHGSGTERMKAPKATEQQLLRLQVSNGTNSDEAIVVFNANASNNLDAYDSYKMSNNNMAVPEIYTLIANEELVINGMNSNNLQAEIPLGFRTGTLSTFSLKATEATNFKSDTHIILKDNVLNKQTDLTDGSQYTFSSDVANTTGRFSLIFKSAGVTTDVENTNSNLTNLVFVNNNGQIVIQNTTGLLRSFNIYNSIGQLVEKNTALNSTATSSKLNTGVYFVHLQNENNINTVCKVKVD